MTSPAPTDALPAPFHPDPVPVVVVVDEGYFGHEAIVDELGPGFDVTFADGLSPLVNAVAGRALPLVLTPQALAPQSGVELLAALTQRRVDFIGLLMLDDDREPVGPGVHVMVRRPLRPGQLAEHLKAAALLRGQWLHTVQRRDALGHDIARLRDGLRHDVRGYLQSIIGLSSLLLELERPQRKAEDELVDFVGRILSSAERLDRYIDHIGDWLQLSRKPLEPTIVDLGELALEVVAEVRSRHTKPPELLTTLTPPPCPRVPGDARILGLALRHLIDHCLEQTGKAEVAVVAHASGWSLTVRDHAFKQLPATYRACAYELFERAAGGTGVQLAVVAKVAQRLGGKTRLEAHPDGGHLFSLDLPDKANEPSGPQ